MRVSLAPHPATVTPALAPAAECCLCVMHAAVLVCPSHTGTEDHLLRRHQLAVAALPGQQLIVGALLSNAPRLHHHYLIRRLHGAQPAVGWVNTEGEEAHAVMQEVGVRIDRCVRVSHASRSETQRS